MNWRLFDAAYWHERAEESRAVADEIIDPECKSIMLRVAEGYESLARRRETFSLINATQDRSIQKDQEAKGDRRK